MVYANLTNLGRHEYVAGVGNGIAKCPFDPEDNSTAVWVENGNPGEMNELFMFMSDVDIYIVHYLRNFPSKHDLQISR